MNTVTQSNRFFASLLSAKQLLLVSDILAFLAVWSLALGFGPRNALWIAGLLIGVFGFLVWMVARRQLGDAFMIGAAAKQLVTTGLYRRFRHPIYLFGGLANFGALLALQNWWLLLLWLAYAGPIQWTRLRRENQVLEARFGEAFLQHRSQTWI